MSGLDADGWRAGARDASQELASAGLDLAKWFSIPEANRSLKPEHRLPELGTIGVVLGNTLALWRPFTLWKQAHPDLNEPLDTYVEEQVLRSLTPLGPAWIGFAHHLSPAPIPIQRYAAASGLAQMSPVGLSVHPMYGPWIALRAVAVFAAPAVALEALSNRASHEGSPLESTDAHPCDACSRPCLAPFAEAMSAPTKTARRFLPVRMSCPVGVQFRYGKEQLDYHYGCATLQDR